MVKRFHAPRAGRRRTLDDRLDVLWDWYVRLTETNTQDGTFSVALGGQDNRAGGDFAAILGGNSASAPLRAQAALSSGSYAQAGDMQTFTLSPWCITSGATPAVMALGGPTVDERLVLPNMADWAFTGVVLARRLDALGESAMYQVRGLLRRDASAASTTAVWVSVVATHEDDVAWGVTLAADVTNGALHITCTGKAGKTVQWVAFLTVAQTQVTV